MRGVTRKVPFTEVVCLLKEDGNLTERTFVYEGEALTDVQARRRIKKETRAEVMIKDVAVRYVRATVSMSAFLANAVIEEL